MFWIFVPFFLFVLALVISNLLDYYFGCEDFAEEDLIEIDEEEDEPEDLERY